MLLVLCFNNPRKCVLLFSLSVFFGTDMSNSLVVTGGEDRFLNVWKNSDQQVILQPAQSIWAVTILPNTDIVVGSRFVYNKCYTY